MVLAFPNRMVFVHSADESVVAFEAKMLAILKTLSTPASTKSLGGRQRKNKDGRFVNQKNDVVVGDVYLVGTLWNN